jgi:uncharacterized protein YaeQ
VLSGSCSQNNALVAGLVPWLMFHRGLCAGSQKFVAKGSRADETSILYWRKLGKTKDNSIRETHMNQSQVKQGYNNFVECWLRQ